MDEPSKSPMQLLKSLRRNASQGNGQAEQPTPSPREVPDAPDTEEDTAPVRPPLRDRALRVLRSPGTAMVAVLVVFALVNAVVTGRLGGTLTGGRLLPTADLATTWSDYLDAWHAVSGGTGAPAPPSLAVLALLGSVLGGPSVVVSALLLFGAPLAGLSGYLATRGLDVPPLRRALVAGGYALLPASAISAGQGRLDVVVAHVLVPPLLAGIAAVIRRSDGRWLGTACLTAFGLAVLGAFAPLVQLSLILLALLAHVLVPGSGLRGRRRAAGLVALLLLSVACLLPWPVVLLSHPEILLHGLGARVVEQPASVLLAVLSPDGSLPSLAGVLLVLGAVLALAVCFDARMLAGAGVALLGWLVAVVIGTASAAPLTGGVESPGWTGGPLVLVAAGCAWTVLVAKLPALNWKIATPVLAAGFLVLGAASAVGAASGPLQVHQAASGTGTRLVLEPGPQPARLVSGAGPRFGEDDLAPAGAAADWLRQVDEDLASQDGERVRRALAAVAARGADHVIAPSDTRLPELAYDMVVDEGPRPGPTRELRLLVPAAPVKLVGPDLARQAQTEPGPAPEARPLPVDAELPSFSVRISEGGTGRALVLGAENEAGWYATVDGRRVPLATAWGHLVAVPLPAQAAEVQVGYTEMPRTTLLVVQAALVLFTVIAAIPGRPRKVLTALR
ncbi:hypothetical protein EIL87_23875 [Saccharopolyspora rhizosphaerae]|uniref:YfhO family protein n=1 Tax=Saccharopolyspora rhizosphaerae TaxID=2492662 RepID=A0A3R8NYN9_9PSEU|nr:hypothetical protein [Saccharopolyspora rhizosphaerae]RRO12737.1 hypothetical protein EIL87_23875 [Saccharopolyspora rhizosphaerae]